MTTIESRSSYLLIPKDARLVPCPYCGANGAHRGTCDLGLMRSGKTFVVVAVPVAVEEGADFGVIWEPVVDPGELVLSEEDWMPPSVVSACRKIRALLRRHS